jgi:small subunit ribosomal protein S4e
MGTIAGSKKLKRQMSPLFWKINRKDKRFVITVRPGSHPKNNSIPSAVLLRDTLNIVKTLREAKSSIYGGKVKVDGVIQKSLHHSIGLMDVVELENSNDIYRLVPKNGQILFPIKINQNEKSKKLVKVKSKTSISGGRTQLGFHDGRTVITDTGANAGRVGTINEIKGGTFTLPKRISLLIDDNTVEIPAQITMAIGKEKPIIQIE